MKISSKQKGIRVKSSNPSFNYTFKEADKWIEIPEEHSIKILKNPNFYESNESEQAHKIPKPSKIKSKPKGRIRKD